MSETLECMGLTIMFFSDVLCITVQCFYDPHSPPFDDRNTHVEKNLFKACNTYYTFILGTKLNT